MSHIKVCFLLLLCVLGLSQCVAISKDKCLSAGFNPSVLLCDTCEQMKKAVVHDTIYDTCKSCCIVPVEEKFMKAVLEVDNRYLTYQPEIEAMVALKKSLNFAVKYRFGSPMLKMYTKESDNEPSETISVGSWSKDNFKEYLQSHLK